MNALHDSLAIEAIYGNIERQKLQLIALCSPQAQSGNSLLALALAKRAALAGKKVLLVEMNLQHPSLAQRCNAQSTQWPAGSKFWADALYETDQPGLKLLIAPKDDLPHIELKSQDLLSELFSQLKTQFDLIFCDTSPLLNPAAGDIPADMVCSACQGTILNVLSNVDTECQIAQCADILKSCGAHISGAVMNDNVAPSLKQELLRETYRLEKKLPKLMSWLRQKIDKSMLISQKL